MLRLLNNTDTETVMGYINRNPIETTFLYSNVLNFGLENDGIRRRCADYYGYFEDETLKGILPFYNLGSCIPHYEAAAAIPGFAELMEGRNFSYLLGMENLVKPLYEAVKESKKLLQYSEDCYHLNNDFTPFILEGVEFVDAKDLPLPIVEDFLMEAHKDGFRAAANRQGVARMLSERSAEEDFIFLVKEGSIRAQANIQTYTDRVCQIGGVFTLPSERGNGFCKAIVSELCKRIIQRGKLPTLMVRKNNTPAVRAYTALGFKSYEDYLIINFESN